MRATRHLPHRENLRPTPWRRSPNRRHRTPMYRIILFLLLIALAAAGAAWGAAQTGGVVLSGGGVGPAKAPAGVWPAHRRNTPGPALGGGCLSGASRRPRARRRERGT